MLSLFNFLILPCCMTLHWFVFPFSEFYAKWKAMSKEEKNIVFFTVDLVNLLSTFHCYIFFSNKA